MLVRVLENFSRQFCRVYHKQTTHPLLSPKLSLTTILLRNTSEIITYKKEQRAFDFHSSSAVCYVQNHTDQTFGHSHIVVVPFMTSVHILICNCGLYYVVKFKQAFPSFSGCCGMCAGQTLIGCACCAGKNVCNKSLVQADLIKGSDL